MPYVLGVLAVLFLGFLVIGAVSGRVKMSACCTVADASRDLRMRDAFEAPRPEIGPDAQG
jgi:hypothetical protein